MKIVCLRDLKSYRPGLLVSMILLPALVSARQYSQDLFGIFDYIIDVFNDIVLWFITTGAVMVFLGYIAYQLLIIMYRGRADENFKKYLFYGLIALTVMFTFYAVASLIASTFNIRLAIPQFFQDQTGLTPGSGHVPNSRSILDYY